MQSVLVTSLLLVPALAVSGCPVYDDRCDRDRDCGPGYECNRRGDCVLIDAGNGPNDAPVRCTEPSDCVAGETCDRFGRCRIDDCSGVGCVTGFACVPDADAFVCEADGSAGAGGGGAGGEGGAAVGGGGAG